MFQSDFPIFQSHNDLVFLDSASSAQKPKQVIDAIRSYLSTNCANIHRGAYDLSMESSTLYERAKESLAKKLGARTDEIVFTYNATYAYNLLARGLFKSGILQSGDTVLLTKAEHHANIVPWQIMAGEHDINIDWVDLHQDGTIDYDSLEQKLPNARICSITGASNVTGEILDIDRVQSLFNALSTEKPIFILDGSQRFPHIQTDMERYGIDFFVGTGHKVMSDTGIGFFAGRKDIIQTMSPAFCGGGAINMVTTQGYDAAGLPFRHEPGTPHIVGAVSLLAALDYIDSIGGFEVIEQYEIKLTQYALGAFREAGFFDPESTIHLIGSQSHHHRLGVFSFLFDHHHPNDIAEMLADENICVRAGHHCTDPLHHTLNARGSLRASTYIYNTKSDIDRLVTSIQKYVT